MILLPRCRTWFQLHLRVRRHLSFYSRLITGVLPLQPLQLQAPQVLHAAEQHHKAVTAAAVKHVNNKKAEEATEGNYVTFKKGDLVMVYVPAVR